MRPVAPNASLVIESVTARKRRARAFQRIMSGLERDGHCRLLTLTSSITSGNFQRDFRCLIMRLRRRGLVTDYIRIAELTRSGLRHDHILIRGGYIEQVYLGKLWASIHSAPIVDIRKAYGNRRLSNYLAKYLAKDSVARMSYSWGWVWRGLAKSWTRLLKFAREMGWNFDKVLTVWRVCVKVNYRPENFMPGET